MSQQVWAAFTDWQVWRSTFYREDGWTQHFYAGMGISRRPSFHHSTWYVPWQHAKAGVDHASAYGITYFLPYVLLNIMISTV
jgi:hypothetical protein